MAGGVQRATGQERIEYLAYVRNKAAEPMMQACTQTKFLKRDVTLIVSKHGAS